MRGNTGQQTGCACIALCKRALQPPQLPKWATYPHTLLSSMTDGGWTTSISCGTSARSLLRVLQRSPIVQDLHELCQRGGLLPSAHAGVPARQERLDAGRMLRQGPAQDEGACQQAVSFCLRLRAPHCLWPQNPLEASLNADIVSIPATCHASALRKKRRWQMRRNIFTSF